MTLQCNCLQKGASFTAWEPCADLAGLSEAALLVHGRLGEPREPRWPWAAYSHVLAGAAVPMETWQHGHGHSTRRHLGASTICDLSGHQDWTRRDREEEVSLGGGCRVLGGPGPGPVTRTCAQSCTLRVPAGVGAAKADCGVPLRPSSQDRVADPTPRSGVSGHLEGNFQKAEGGYGFSFEPTQVGCGNHPLESGASEGTRGLTEVREA